MHLARIFLESQEDKRLDDVVRRNRLLRVLLARLVGFGRDEVDELDTALNQEIARVFRAAHIVRQVVLDQLLDRGFGERQLLIVRRARSSEIPLVLRHRVATRRVARAPLHLDRGPRDEWKVPCRCERAPAYYNCTMTQTTAPLHLADALNELDDRRIKSIKPRT